MIRFIIHCYIYLLLLDAVLSYIPDLRSQPWAKKIHEMVEYTVRPVRKYIPDNDLPIDIAPLAIILVLVTIMEIW